MTIIVDVNETSKKKKKKEKEKNETCDAKDKYIFSMAVYKFICSSSTRHMIFYFLIYCYTLR